MNLSFKRLSIDASDGVIVAKLDGGSLSVLDPELVDELCVFIDAVDTDPEVSAVVFTGTHARRFISHADIPMLQAGGSESPSLGRTATSVVARIASAVANSAAARRLASHTPLAGAVQLDRFHDALLQMNSSGVVFIAALNGSTLGGGAEFAWSCDIRVMTDDEDCFIGQPEVLLGFNPGGGGTQRLPRLIGNHRALIAMLQGRPLSPAEALEVGAVDELAPHDEVLARAVSWARTLGSRPKKAIAAIKRSVYFGGSMALPAGLHTERAEFLHVLGSDEAQAIMKAYMQSTDTVGELPLYNSGTYETALSTGRLPNATGSNTHG
ncbi:MAG: enoyl-CoA hydratase/isomerase family protein [Mycobacterium sp.]